MANSSTKTSTRITLTGNLGHDPEERTIPAKQFIKNVYDPVVDGEVERITDFPERNFLTFSVACGGKGDAPVRWIDCVDWEGEAWRARKGDRVELTGHFENRSFTTKTGEKKTKRQFVVATCSILRMKCREAD